MIISALSVLLRERVSARDEPLLFFWTGYSSGTLGKKKPLTGSPATDVGEIFYWSGHTAAPSLPHCCHIHPALPQPPSPSLPPSISCHSPTPNPPFALSPARVHPPLFIYFIYYLIYFSQNLPPRFEPTSHVGERATLKPPLATGESLFCHAFILASCECRPSHASGEPTGVQMTVLCSQTAMNNETEVMYEVADAGRGGKKKKTLGTHARQRAFQQHRAA